MGKYHFAHCVTKAKIPDEMNKGFGNSVPFNNFQLILLRLLRTMAVGIPGSSIKISQDITGAYQ